MHGFQYMTNQSMHGSKYVTNHQLEKDVSYKVLGIQTQQLLKEEDELGHMSPVIICL